MKKMNFIPPFLYQMKEYLISIGAFFATIVVVTIVSLISAWKFEADISFAGFGAISMICMFVVGVVLPRQYLRLGIQCGISRRTTFVSGLASALVCNVMLAVGGALLFAAANALSVGTDVVFPDLYQLFYLHDSISDLVQALTFAQQMRSIALNTALSFCAYTGGMFFTLLFWRLNKIGSIIAAISIPVLLNLIPLMIYRSRAASAVASNVMNWVSFSVWNLILLFTVVSVAAIVVNWLLARHANIKAPSGK
jgi:hypothetical protein